MKPEDFLLDDSFLAWYFRSDHKEWKRWEVLRKQDPVMRSRMDEAVKIIEAIVGGNVKVEADRQTAAKARLMNRIQKWEREKENTARARRIGRRGFLWMGAAASVALLITLAYRLFPGGQPDAYFAKTEDARRIELPDGSVVNLNGNSSLRTHFAQGKEREVWLEGEAYFKVSKKPSGEKFIVHTGDLDVEVLGTEFNVRGHREKTEVVLESGKVQLSRPESAEEKEKIIMEPGEMAEFSKSSGAITKRDVNTKVYTSWKEGKVIFENAGVGEIASILRDRYGLQVKVEEGSILGEFNGIFPSDDPEIVITALEKTYSGKIVRGDQSITFRR